MGMWMLESLRGGKELGSGTGLSLSQHPPNPHSCSQCLRPEDVAEAVIYVLSTPPHVQVSVAFAVYPLGRA